MKTKNTTLIGAISITSYENIDGTEANLIPLINGNSLS